MRCQYCQKLSISLLIELASQEFIARTFPPSSYFKHQPSFLDLCASAENGCAFCVIILRGLKDCVLELPIWEGRSRADLIEAAEGEGRASDIKMAINASHLFYSRRTDMFEEVKLFDLLMVQVGMVEDIYETDDTPGVDAVPPLEFVIQSTETESQSLNKFRVGRRVVDPDLASQKNIDLALSWLDKCQEHDNCPAFSPATLPTRVIDVGMDENFQDVKLLISGGKRAHYVTLSHCWGGQISPVLTSEDLNAWREGIRFGDLPANFQDAIQVTKQLGFRYIWIDALCIIQNSEQDWESESKQMGMLYRNSSITISLATSHKSTEGFLKNLGSPYKPEDTTSIRLLSTSTDLRSVNVAFKPHSEDDENLATLFSEGALHKRGWCLQETVISPRILHYGSRQIYYQCVTGFESADAVPAGSREPHGHLYSNFSSIVHQSKMQGSTDNTKLHAEGAQQEYYGLVKDYMDRKLSFSVDKFPAFSGLARLMQPAFEDSDYIAGVWSKDIVRGLCWYDEMGTCKHLEGSYRSPSWSWAITDEAIVWSFNQAQETSIADGRYDVEFVAFERVLQGKSGDTYGQLANAKLIVKGYTKRLVRSRQNVGMRWPENGCALVRYDELEKGLEQLQNRCHVFEVSSEDNDDYLLSIINGNDGSKWEWKVDESAFYEDEYLVIVVQAVSSHIEGFEVGGGTGLALRKVEHSDDMYERVGFVNLGPTDDMFSMNPADFERWMDAWKKQTISLV